MNSRVHDLGPSFLLLLSRKCQIKTSGPGLKMQLASTGRAAHFHLSDETSLGASQGRRPSSRDPTLNLGLHLFALQLGSSVALIFQLRGSETPRFSPKLWLVINCFFQSIKGLPHIFSSGFCLSSQGKLRLPKK